MGIRRGARLWVGRTDAPAGAPHHPLVVERADGDLVYLRGDIAPIVTAMRLDVLSPQPTTCLVYRASVVDVRTDSIGLILDEQVGSVQRREWLRVAVDLPVRATVARPPATGARWDTLDSVTVDVSAGGLRLGMTGHSVPDGLPLSVDITLPSGPVHATATPVRGRCDDKGMSVRFVTINGLDRERLVAAALQRQRLALAAATT